MILPLRSEYPVPPLPNDVLTQLCYAPRREQLRGVIATGEKLEGWPLENTVRAQYYRSQALRRLAAASNSSDAKAVELERTALEHLDNLLKLDRWGMADRCRGDYPMLFDYLVHWENRLVTPRQSVGAAAGEMANTWRWFPCEEVNTY